MTLSLDVGPVSSALKARQARLRDDLRAMGRVVVAFSGGVDSAFLARVAHDELGDAALALTARSASLMQAELDDASALAKTIGIRHRIVDTGELGRAEYRVNDTNRCYFCKTELFDAAVLAAEAFAGAVVVDGFNADDLRDHRPGHRAAAEHAVRHPLADAGLTKADIRALSRELGLPTWKKPQLACLSSRLPYGLEVTPERLARVEAVEMALRAEGFFDLRARLVTDNDDMVRIEVGAVELPRLVDPGVRGRVVTAARQSGFRFVTVDLEGYRSGRMNEGLVQLGPKKR